MNTKNDLGLFRYINLVIQASYTNEIIEKKLSLKQTITFDLK